MKGAAVWLASLLLFGCGKSGPTATLCTRGDVDNACSQPTTATPLEGGGWSVDLRITITEEVPYKDGGVQCSYTKRSCVGQECDFYGDPSMTAQQAIQACEDSYYGR